LVCIPELAGWYSRPQFDANSFCSLLACWESQRDRRGGPWLVECCGSSFERRRSRIFLH